MAVVSSNCFALNSLSSGLTKYEMRKLVRLKILNSVVLENLPQVEHLPKCLKISQNLCLLIINVILSCDSQLFFQALYAATSAGLTTTVMFASTASLLSVIASLLTFCIECTNDHDMKTVQYYLALEKEAPAAPGPVPVRMPSTMDMDDPEGDLEDGRIAGHGTVGSTSSFVPTALTPGSLSLMSSSKGEITTTEREHIMRFRGLRLKLSRSLSQIWHSLVATVKMVDSLRSA